MSEFPDAPEPAARGQQSPAAVRSLVPEPPPSGPPRPSLRWLFAWSLAAVVVTFASLASVGIAAYGSESAGVVAASIAALPFGFVWTGFFGAVVGRYLFTDNVAARRFAPLGCGCGGGLLFSFVVFFFFVAIFPAL